MDSAHSVPYGQQERTLASSAATRKRRKQDGTGEDGGGAEPRRLRRSHEACARCRSKKIRCDSKYPKCTACATAGADCQQENRLKQTLQPRGHTEQLERQLALAGALLKRYIPEFEYERIDDLCMREGIDINAVLSALNSTDQPHKLFTFPAPNLGPPSYPIHLPYAPPPPGASYPPVMPPGTYPLPAYQHPPPFPIGPPAQPKIIEIIGQDPQSNDMSNTEALAKNFGVNAAIVKGLQLNTNGADREDLAVGSNGLTSGRDRQLADISIPRNKAHWVSVPVQTTNDTEAHIDPSSAPPTAVMAVWLPKDRDMVKHIVEVYFKRLNHHRPVFPYSEFDKTLHELYAGQLEQHDPGFLCSFYLVLALGTLSELSHRTTELDQEENSEQIAKNLMPPDWPTHQEFFDCALLVKPDLRVTLSSLQALILLHWYLYTERQGRTLWRLVGSLVRLSLELGLHHEPTSQQKVVGSEMVSVFTPEQCQLRINLWAIVMIHDRGTSILLGRPLGIAPEDFNTPAPRKEHSTQFSEHFEFSTPVAHIQADIINSLYRPKNQSSREIIGHAKRIIKSMVDFRETLPESYRWYFNGAEDWPLDQRCKLVEEITEDQGLTLLKLGISRILLLRALFNCKLLNYNDRHKALVDAIVASHNIIVIHRQLIRYPDTAFFTSPIPLHIAAMVILYGHMSRCDKLSRQVALEDMWLALDMLPRFRWRWERKDQAGGHPLIAKLAARVMEVDLHTINPPTHTVLLSEEAWDTAEGTPSTATVQSPMSTPPTATSSYAPAPAMAASYGPHSQPMANGPPVPYPRDQFVDVPDGLFYPFYPEEPAFSVPPTPTGTAPTAPRGHPQHQYASLLAAASPHLSGYGVHASQNQYIFGERDGRYSHPHSEMQQPHMWPPNR